MQEIIVATDLAKENASLVKSQFENLKDNVDNLNTFFIKTLNIDFLESSIINHPPRSIKDDVVVKPF